MVVAMAVVAVTLHRNAVSTRRRSVKGAVFGELLALDSWAATRALQAVRTSGSDFIVNDNIASSFRSLYKLGFLYSESEIDAGVFITSIDKNNCATRIWPVSNRNGSFQELKQRNYKRMVVLPLWEFGFAPDGFWVRRIF